MSKWLIKTAVQRAISLLPQNHKWNALLQKYITRNLHVSVQSFEEKLGECRTHLENYHSFDPKPKDTFTVMELGTGWWPILPIGFYLCGAEEVWTYDIKPLLRMDTLHRVIKLYLEFSRNGKLTTLLPRARPERIHRLQELFSNSTAKSPAEFLGALNIRPVIGDARHTDLPPGSINLVYSNLCFEHIPLSIQAGLYAEFKRVATKESLISQFVGIGDQYSNFDQSITLFNYLKYTAKQWRVLDNPMIPQTRLRACDYRKAIEQAGYDVLMQRNIHGPKEDLASITLAPEFRHYSEDDLLTCHAWFVARPR